MKTGHLYSIYLLVFKNITQRRQNVIIQLDRQSYCHLYRPWVTTKKHDHLDIYFHGRYISTLLKCIMQCSLIQWVVGIFN